MKPVSDIGRKIVHNIFSKQRILVELGAKVTNIQHGIVELHLPKSQLALQHHGFFHGGIISTLADTAAGLAGHSVLNNEQHSAITIQLKINFIRPGDGDSLVCIGKILKQNKTLMITTAEVYTNDKLCAYMLQTIKRITPEQKPSLKVI